MSVVDPLQDWRPGFYMDHAISIDEISNFIQSKFSPAKDLSDSDCDYTTNDILIELTTHFGELPYTKEQIVKCLKEAGFKYDSIAGLKMCWVFKNKSTS